MQSGQLTIRVIFPGRPVYDVPKILSLDNEKIGTDRPRLVMHHNSPPFSTKPQELLRTIPLMPSNHRA